MESNSTTTMESSAKTKNGIKRLIFTGIAIALEMIVILFLLFRLQEYAEWVEIASRVAALIICLLIYNQNKNSSMKMPWMILIMVAPLFGSVLYLLIGLAGSTKKMRKRYVEIDKVLFPLLPDGKEAVEKLEEKDPRIAGIAHYLHDKMGYPVYDQTDIEYFDDAAKGLAAQKEELRKAEKFIFMEYHAIEDAESWHGILEILEEKVHNGVEVRVFYDDMGSIGFINTDFVKRMEAKGIRCRVFNPFSSIVNIFLNNRDHRKITVIDGKVGFTGGYNIANEYFNITHPFGQWKDTGIKLTGDAVKSLTIAFLEMWNAVSDKDKDDTDFIQYLPDTGHTASEEAFVIPYADSPMDHERVGEDVYISMAEYASKYVWFITPYLILTDEMNHTLGLAAKRGVDVRIITPGIPDKKLVYSMTRSYYHRLVEAGVRIYEYTPGFCHAKMSVSDDKAATCGTINLDYRSLYHHFENGCLYYGCDAVMETRADFERTFDESREVTEDYRKLGAGWHAIHLILRLFSPLL